MEEQESQQTSKYNEAVNQLTRLNFLWQSCNELSTSGNLLKWKWRLDAVWRELSASAIKLDKQKKTPNSFFSEYTKDKNIPFFTSQWDLVQPLELSSDESRRIFEEEVTIMFHLDSNQITAIQNAFSG